jgi:hypothetical protein
VEGGGAGSFTPVPRSKVPQSRPSSPLSATHLKVHRHATPCTIHPGQGQVVLWGKCMCMACKTGDCEARRARDCNSSLAPGVQHGGLIAKARKVACTPQKQSNFVTHRLDGAVLLTGQPTPRACRGTRDGAPTKEGTCGGIPMKCCREHASGCLPSFGPINVKGPCSGPRKSAKCADEMLPSSQPEFNGTRVSRMAGIEGLTEGRQVARPDCGWGGAAWQDASVPGAATEW